MNRALADSYRAELVRAARKGTGFDPTTGEPAGWAALEPVTVTWYQHAVAYAESRVRAETIRPSHIQDKTSGQPS